MFNIFSPSVAIMFNIVCPVVSSFDQCWTYCSSISKFSWIKMVCPSEWTHTLFTSVHTQTIWRLYPSEFKHLVDQNIMLIGIQHTHCSNIWNNAWIKSWWDQKSIHKLLNISHTLFIHVIDQNSNIWGGTLLCQSQSNKETVQTLEPIHGSKVWRLCESKIHTQTVEHFTQQFIHVIDQNSNIWGRTLSCPSQFNKDTVQILDPIHGSKVWRLCGSKIHTQTVENFTHTIHTCHRSEFKHLRGENIMSITIKQRHRTNISNEWMESLCGLSFTEHCPITPICFGRSTCTVCCFHAWTTLS